MSGHEERAAVAGAAAYLGIMALGLAAAVALCVLSVFDDAAAGVPSDGSPAACAEGEDDEA